MMRFHLEETDQKHQARILVLGVGGCGCNAVNHMIECNIAGVEFIVVNTDAQALDQCGAHTKVQVGANLTKGLGAGADPEIGRLAAEEDREQIREAIAGADMVFVTAGMGGGTGTGAAPIVGAEAQEMGALVVGIVTTPMVSEGRVRTRRAQKGIEELKKHLDTMIVVSNQHLVELVEQSTSMLDAFQMADDILRQGVQSISDLITIPGVINLDFADVRTIMKGAGKALMGIGMTSGPHRAVEAAKLALNSPLLENSNIQGAKGVILNISGGRDLTMYEINEATKVIKTYADPDADIIFGFVVEEDKVDEVRVTVIATGFEPDKRGRVGAGHQEQLDFDNPIDYDSPAFLRKAACDSQGEEALSADNSHWGRNLDIPTYLRRKQNL